MKLQVMIISDFYLPGYKAGGPIRSIANLVDQLGEDFDFYIITRDRDLGDSDVYPNIALNCWEKVGKANVYYMSTSDMWRGKLEQLLRNTYYDILYINSFFSPGGAILPLLLMKLNRVKRKPVIVAPRGEFSLGALSLKKFKKTLYITIAKMLNLYKGALWQASSSYEQQDILRVYGKAPVMIASDIAPNFNLIDKNSEQISKKPGHLKVLFLSRITRMKNLTVALDALSKIKGQVEFNIYGPIEDPAYWMECEDKIRSLPSNVTVNVLGIVSHDQVKEVMSNHHLFLFPTLGENYGHVIIEALQAGCPVLLSDQTPWNQIEKYGAGWNHPLHDVHAFTNSIQICVDMENALYSQMSKNARMFGQKYISNEEVLDQNRNMFFHGAARTI